MRQLYGDGRGLGEFSRRWSLTHGPAKISRDLRHPAFNPDSGGSMHGILATRVDCQGSSLSAPLTVWTGYLADQCPSLLIWKMEGAELTVRLSCKQSLKIQARSTAGVLCYVLEVFLLIFLQDPSPLSPIFCSGLGGPGQAWTEGRKKQTMALLRRATVNILV